MQYVNGMTPFDLAVHGGSKNTLAYFMYGY